MNQNNLALKEWDVAVNALSEGTMILLLRKGGIKEIGKGFKLEQENFWLYPTFEHQKPELLKENYREFVTPVTSGWHPETVEIKGKASVTHSFLIDDPEIINNLLPYHIWNEKFISDRLKFKPKQPLNILLLRVYNLPQPVTISYSQEYSGCRSWLNLLEQISEDNLTPVFDDFEYQKRLETLTKIIM